MDKQYYFKITTNFFNGSKETRTIIETGLEELYENVAFLYKTFIPPIRYLEYGEEKFNISSQDFEKCQSLFNKIGEGVCHCNSGFSAILLTDEEVEKLNKEKKLMFLNEIF